MTILIWKVFLGLTACSNHSSDESLADKTSSESSLMTSQLTKSLTIDSTAKYKDELTKIYIQAIVEFIKAVNKKDKTTFDTLYFGRRDYGQPDDFPDIELPHTIENTQIRLVAPDVGQKKQTEQKSLVYVNLIAWVDSKSAEFVFVVFTNGGEHQYDYFINFISNNTTNQYDLDKIEFENYLQLNEQKPKRTKIFEDGQYIIDK